MFRDSIHALLCVLEERGTDMSKRGAVTEISVRKDCLRNGVIHCHVELVCNDGAGYGIDAFGDEADELCRVAKTRSTPAKISYLFTQVRHAQSTL